MSDASAEAAAAPEPVPTDVPAPGTQDGGGEQPLGEAATEPAAEAPITVEDLIETLESVTLERDEYLDSLQRLQADFENFRRRSQSDSEQRVAAGTGRIAEALLPVLDACSAAMGQGIEGVDPIASALSLALGKEGLERIEAVGAPFDPNEHEAVLHEAGDGGEQVVVEELRPGFRWQGRVLRAAMVKVQN
ncbi:MAG: molecular chaperone GrpE [Candidatus Poriferisodalaceae bacterium]